MKRFFFSIILLLFCLCMMSFILVEKKLDMRRHSKWKLVWSENFNERNLDSSIWSKIPKGDVDWNKYMSVNKKCYEIENGNLILRGIINKNTKNDSIPFVTGGIWTKNKFTLPLQNQGRLEIKARFDEGQGVWPAIWMVATDRNKLGKKSEVDIMEHLNYDGIVYQTVHNIYIDSTKIHNFQNTGTNHINQHQYNIYSVEFYPDSLRFFVNDIHTFTYSRKDDQPNLYTFNKNFYLILSMQLGGQWVGKVNTKTLPVEMKVDWIHYYQENKLKNL